MTKLYAGGRGHAVTLAVLFVAGACGGAPSGLGSDELGLEFVDGPADHVGGAPIPPFRVWVVDRFGRRATGLEGGTLTLDLLDPGGAVQAAGFATVPLSFGQGTVVPSISLQAGDGYSVRGRFEQTTADSPPFSVVSGPDVVRMTNPSTGEVGLIVDGANNIGRLQDSTHRTTMSHANVGVLNSGTLTHEVAAFAPDRRPELVPVTWTAAADTLSIALRDPVPLPITVWIVTGSFADEKTQIELALTQLDQEWRRERAGVEVDDVEVMDATPLASPFEFFAVVTEGAPFGAIQTGVGRAAGRLNIYVVSEIREAGEFVDGFAEFRGTAIAVTSGAVASLGPRLLGHQLGHNFGLRHPDNVVGFEISPNMMTTGQGSMALTEGQIFRMHFDRFSPLLLFRTADTFAPRSCDAVEATTDCPELSFRIWSEAEPASISSSRQTAHDPRSWTEGGPLARKVAPR